jgi:hypothetical protein
MKTGTALLLAIVAEVVVAAVGILDFGWGIEGLQATTRFSGRLSLLIFSFIFLLHPGNKDFLSRLFSRNYFLFFAVAHGIHLAELLSYVYLSGIALVPIRVAGGFMAYALIFLMPWFQQKFDAHTLDGKKFHALGSVYLFYVWFVFFMTYVARLNGSFQNAGGSYAEHATLMGWVCLILAIKIIRILLRHDSEPPHPISDTKNS